MNTRTYDGMLSGLSNVDGDWLYEGRTYDTPATEADVIACANEAMSEPDASVTAAARKLVFGSNVTYTSQALLGIAAAYDAEVGPDGDGSAQIMAILQEAARRIACIEALTI